MQKILTWVVGPLVTVVALVAAYLLIVPWNLQPVAVPGTTTEESPLTSGISLGFLAITCVVAAVVTWAFRTRFWLVAVMSSVPATCLFVASCLNTDWPDAALWPVDVPFVLVILAVGSAATAMATQLLLGRGWSGKWANRGSSLTRESAAQDQA